MASETSQPDAAESSREPPVPQVLVFSKTTGYRHDSIAAGIEAISSLADAGGWGFRSTEDSGVFTAEGLLEFNVLVFLSTTGDVLDEPEQAAMEAFIRAGNGFVGVHSASDTEYDWPWYGALLGAYFKAHPAIQPATLRVEDRAHPASAHLGAAWSRTDEWYGFVTNPRSHVNVLLSLDEASYDPGDGAMGGDHPITWYHEYDGGRSFYTALGHAAESYAESDFLRLLDGAIRWAAGSTR